MDNKITKEYHCLLCRCKLFFLQKNHMKLVENCLRGENRIMSYLNQNVLKPTFHYIHNVWIHSIYVIQRLKNAFIDNFRTIDNGSNIDFTFLEVSGTWGMGSGKNLV